MALQAGKMYRPSDVAFDIANDTVYVVEKFNHRISKWNYTAGSFAFTLDAGQVTSVVVNNGGTGYTDGDLVTFSAPTLDIANPVIATGEVAETAGVIDSITILNPGNGYDPNNLPTVDATAIGNGDAVLTAVVSAPWGNNVDGTTGEGAPIGLGDSTDNALDRPSGIVFDATNTLLYVTDTFHNRVRVITPSTGAFTTSLGTGGFDTDEFYHPAGIAINVGTDDTVVIADELNHRAVKYTTNAGTLDSPVVLVDPSVTTGLSFVRPHGVVYDVTAIEFNVGDSQRGLISSYNVAGIFQNQYGTPGSTTDNVNLFFPTSGQGLLTATNVTVFADTRNNALKTMNNETIALITADGSTPNAGTAGTGDGQIYYPESTSAFVDTANYVLTSNTRNHRVEVFSNVASVLTFQDNFGSP